MSEWTKARDAMLAELWGEDKTAKQIAALMGVTRNAVIGRAHRLKLSKRASPIKADPEEVEAARHIRRLKNRSLPTAQRAAERREYMRNYMKEKRQRAAEAKSNPGAVLPRARGRMAVIQAQARSEAAQAAKAGPAIEGTKPPAYLPPPRMTNGACRWPIGDPKQVGFHFCDAKPVKPGKPYCEKHCAIAYRKPDQPADEVADKEAA